jgi:DNA-binding NtrC family response regulator
VEPLSGTHKLSRSALAQRHAALRVTVSEGPDRGLVRVVERPRVLIGRAEAADVCLRDPAVSQFHLELGPTLRGIQLTDLGSRNGVWLGPLQVERGVVPEGQPITLGNTTLCVHVAHELPAPPAAAPRSAFGELVGQAGPMQALYALLARLAPTELSLLIEGETGTGKELVARAVHAASRRSTSGPFVVLDCTAIPSTLAASVLFGHEKGAFTGAFERRAGVFEAADGGTLFLDEVGELPLDLQPQLLRVLQQREVTPVGGVRPRPVQVRVLCATWRDLRALVNDGQFREDLYYRLAQATVWLPPLREHREDIPLLVEHFLGRLPAQPAAARAISRDALQLLAQRSYPGNVRELQNTIERLALVAAGPTITPDDLAFERLMSAARERPKPGPAAPGPIEPFKDAKRTLVDEFERAYLERLVDRAGANLSLAASLAGLQRHNLRDLLRRHNMYNPRDE